MTEEYKHQIVWVNRNDLTIKKISEKLADIMLKKMEYGICFVLSKDLSKEELEKLFGDDKE